MGSIPPLLGKLADIRMSSQYGAVYAMSDTGTNLGYFLGIISFIGQSIFLWRGSGRMVDPLGKKKNRDYSEDIVSESYEVYMWIIQILQLNRQSFFDNVKDQNLAWFIILFFSSIFVPFRQHHHWYRGQCYW